MNLIRVKKSFTLIELIIVIILISTTYFLVFSNTNFHIKTDEKRLDLSSLKDYLMKNFEFEKDISFLCIEEKFTCFIKVDGNLDKDFKVLNFFKKVPDVYEYSSSEKKVDFKELRVDNMSYNVIFELKINADYKTNEFIIDTKDNNVFVFNSIFTKPKIYKTLIESLEVFDINKTKVKDAF